MGILTAFNVAYKKKEERNWDKIYVFCDIHSTILKPNYEKDNIPTEFYNLALETLKMMSKDETICLGLYTCSHPEEITQYLELFKSKGVNFEMVNYNDEIKTDKGGYGNYDQKPYMDVLLEDKAGFDVVFDWECLYYYFLDKQFKERKVALNYLNDNLSENVNGHIEQIPFLKSWIIDAMIDFKNEKR